MTTLFYMPDCRVVSVPEEAQVLLRRFLRGGSDFPDTMRLHIAARAVLEACDILGVQDVSRGFALASLSFPHVPLGDILHALKEYDRDHALVILDLAQTVGDDGYPPPYELRDDRVVARGAPEESIDFGALLALLEQINLRCDSRSGVPTRSEVLPEARTRQAPFWTRFRSWIRLASLLCVLCGNCLVRWEREGKSGTHPCPCAEAVAPQNPAYAGFSGALAIATRYR